MWTVVVCGGLLELAERPHAHHDLELEVVRVRDALLVAPPEAAKKNMLVSQPRDRNWLAGRSISLPVTEIGWLGLSDRFLSQRLLLY